MRKYVGVLSKISLLCWCGRHVMCIPTNECMARFISVGELDEKSAKVFILLRTFIVEKFILYTYQLMANGQA